jgi:hypothetical protein
MAFKLSSIEEQALAVHKAGQAQRPRTVLDADPIVDAFLSAHPDARKVTPGTAIGIALVLRERRKRLAEAVLPLAA